MSFLLSKKIRNINYFSNYNYFFDYNNYYIIFTLNCVKARELKSFREMLSSFGIIVKARKSLLLKLNQYKNTALFRSIYFNNIIVLKINYSYYNIFLSAYSKFVSSKNVRPVCVLYNLDTIKLYTKFNSLLNSDMNIVFNSIFHYVLFNILVLLIKINLFLYSLINYFNIKK